MSNTRMLSYEIDALVADRFKASWERMVLLASLVGDDDRPLVDGRLQDAVRAVFQNQSAEPARPRTEAERRWPSPSNKGQTE